MNNDGYHRATAVLGERLLSLAEGLSRFEQTTHSTTNAGTIEDVADGLIKAWKLPSSFNLSELRQRICKLVGQ